MGILACAIFPWIRTKEQEGTVISKHSQETDGKKKIVSKEVYLIIHYGVLV